MSYQVSLAAAAKRQLKKLDKSTQAIIVNALQSLSVNPRPEGVLKMEGAETYRIRVREYRIIYEIQDKQLTVLVVKIGHRRDVYPFVPGQTDKLNTILRSFSLISRIKSVQKMIPTSDPKMISDRPKKNYLFYLNN